MRTFLMLIWLVGLPGFCFAQVSISEVAWMGSLASANHEWIELYNAGDAVVVDGWQLSDGANLTITLTGTIPGDSYFVLERTSEASSPASAFMVYTGALVNTGANLTLTRADGSIVDRIVGGENWQEIGGDNTTKDTAQYTTLGWVTGIPTPGRANVTEASSKEPDTQSSSTVSLPTNPASNPSTTRTKKSASETVRLELADVSLALTIKAQSVAYVNQTIDFSAVASGIGKTPLDSLQYEWNFGDGATASLKNTRHAYQFPGTYVVTAYANFGRHEQVARHEITVLPVALTLDQSPDGAVYVHNTAPYELDISGFVIDGYRRFTFPPRSIILPNQTITFSPSRRLGDVHAGVVIHDAEGVVVAHSARRNEVMATIADVSPSGVAESVVERQPEPVSTQPASNLTAFTFASQNTLGERATETGFNTALLSESASSATATQRTHDDRLPTFLSTTTNRSTSPFSDHRAWPYLAFIGLLLIALFAVWRVRPPAV